MLLKDLILTFMDTNSYLFCCLFKTNYAAFKRLTALQCSLSFPYKRLKCAPPPLTHTHREQVQVSLVKYCWHPHGMKKYACKNVL